MDLTELERAEPPIPAPDDAARVEQLSRTAVDKAVAEDKAERRGFTITKFEQHESGFYHARVTVDGRPIYMHRRYGSWMCPGEQGGRTILKEIEALVLGTSVTGRGKEIKEALQSKVHSSEKAKRLAAAREGEAQEDSSGVEADTDAGGIEHDASDGGSPHGSEVV